MWNISRDPDIRFHLQLIVHVHVEYLSWSW